MKSTQKTCSPKLKNVELKFAMRFYAREQNASRVLAMAWASVHLFVRPSVRLSVCHLCSSNDSKQTMENN